MTINAFNMIPQQHTFHSDHIVTKHRRGLNHIISHFCNDENSQWLFLHKGNFSIAFTSSLAILIQIKYIKAKLKQERKMVSKFSPFGYVISKPKLRLLKSCYIIQLSMNTKLNTIHHLVIYVLHKFLWLNVMTHWCTFSMIDRNVTFPL